VDNELNKEDQIGKQYLWVCKEFWICFIQRRRPCWC